MAIKETYLARLKQMREKHPDAHFEVVTATAKSILAPSWNLLEEYKIIIKDETKESIKKIFEEAYRPRYEREILHDNNVHDKLKELARMSLTKDVYLVCYEKEYPCHRFILKDWIENYRAAFRGIEVAFFGNKYRLGEKDE